MVGKYLFPTGGGESGLVSPVGELGATPVPRPGKVCCLGLERRTQIGGGRGRKDCYEVQVIL